MRFKSRKALGQEKHTFVVDIVSLSPWPSLHGPLIVEYQRGNKKRGHSAAADPIDIETGVTRYEWGSAGRPQQFVIDATLYRGKDGSLEQKLMNLFVCQVDEKGKPGNMVAGVVLDLAQLVGLPEQSVRQLYGVECSQSIVEMAGGRPQLAIGLRRRVDSGIGVDNGKGDGGEREGPSGRPGVFVAPGLAPLAGDGGEEGTPSRLSTEIPSSERRMDEQDGSGATVMSPGRGEVAQRGSFKPGNGVGVEMSSEPGAPAMYDDDGFLVEDEGGEVAGDGIPVPEVLDGEGKVGAESTPALPTVLRKNLHEEFRRASVDEEWVEMEKEESAVPDLSPFRTSNQKPVHERRFSRDINSSFGSLHQVKGEGERRAGAGHESPSVASCVSAMNGTFGKDVSGKGQDREEIEKLAALETAVWCAGYNFKYVRAAESNRAQRSSPSKNGGASNPHLKSARRLARTVIALGEADGLVFAKRAVHAIKVACASSLGDVKRLVLWWSALITLRVRFFTLTVEDGKSGSSFFGWLEAASSVLAEAEGLLYTQIVEHVWDAHLAPVTDGSVNASGNANPDVPNVDADVENSIARITSGLESALAALNSLTDVSFSILRTLNRMVLEDMVVKLDVSLLQHWLMIARASPNKPVDSTIGLEIKMLISKLVSYFASHGVEEAVLPRMDSLSNVLVSQKASLLDAEVRKALAPRISINSILTILEQYTMSEDEGTAEDLDKILAALKAKASTTVDLNATYEVLTNIDYSLPDAQTLSQQGIVQSFSLEMDEDSEDEIEELIGATRKQHLLELWGLTAT